jgi:hypothetical protein
MNMFHLLGDARNIMNVLEHTLAHLVAIHFQHINSGATRSSVDAVLNIFILP